MIASHLPDLATVQSYHVTAQEGSSDYEILRRAQELAKVFLSYLESQVPAGGSSRGAEGTADLSNSRHEVMIGGYNSESASRRINKESGRRSVDLSVRHGIDRVRRVTHRLSVRAHGEHEALQPSHRPAPSSAFPVQLRLAYLLISPLLPPIAGFTTMFSKLSFEKKGTNAGATSQRTVAQNLCENPTLAIYGDRDMFTSVRKLQKWANELERMPHSGFMSQEVPGAGHFWHEHGAQEHLCDVVGEWANAILLGIQSKDDDVVSN